MLVCIKLKSTDLKDVVMDQTISDSKEVIKVNGLNGTKKTTFLICLLMLKKPLSNVLLNKQTMKVVL